MRNWPLPSTASSLEDISDGCLSVIVGHDAWLLWMTPGIINHKKYIHPSMAAHALGIKNSSHEINLTSYARDSSTVYDQMSMSNQGVVYI